MIYFDNAATTFPKPQSVIDSVTRCLREYCGNPGRSAHYLALKTAERVYEARETVAKHLGIDSPESVCFTSGATLSLNVAIKCSIKDKCHCIISDCEHNSVIRPLYKLKSNLGIEFDTFNSDKDIYKEIDNLVRTDTRFLISTLSSNVTGKTIPIEALYDISKKHGLTLITDASQALGHIKIDLNRTPANILCGPGHKGLFGIQGVGIMVITDKDARDTLLEGGSGSDTLNPEMPLVLPERYEAGTIPTPGIVSLISGIEFIESIGLDEISNKLNQMTQKAKDILTSFDNIKVYGAENGIISFNASNIPSYTFATRLDNMGFCVRGGLHCAPPIHEKLGTISSGAVRISLSFLNSIGQIDKLYTALRDLFK